MRDADPGRRLRLTASLPVPVLVSARKCRLNVNVRLSRPVILKFTPPLSSTTVVGNPPLVDCLLHPFIILAVLTEAT